MMEAHDCVHYGLHKLYIIYIYCIVHYAIYYLYWSME